MAVPTVVAVGAANAGSAGAVTPAFPAGMAANDIIIGIGESAGAETYPTAATNGFAHVTGSPNTQDTQTTLTVVWARYDGVMTAHSWGDSGNHNMARYIAIRGVKPTGNPWNVSPVAGVESTANTSAEFPTVTTTAVDCLILFCIATGRDLATTANLGALTGGTGLTNVVEQMDNWTASGTGGGFGLVTATKAAAGSTGTPTATMGSTDTKALITIALEPAPPATVAIAQTATVTAAAQDASVVPLVGGTEITAAAEDWTGTNGAAWDTGRWETSGTGTIDIQSNEGRIVSPATAFAVNHVRAIVSDLTDCELLARFAYGPVTAADPRVHLRADANASAPTKGYLVGLNQGQQFLYKTVSGTNTLIDQVGSRTFAAGTFYWIRFRAEGTTISVKVWPFGGAEPGAWDYQATGQTDTASGVPRFAAGTGATGADTTDVRWDHFRLGSLAAAATTATAETATVTAAAQDAVAAVGPVAEAATATAAAQDATAVTTTGTVATAETATVTAAAQDATIAVVAQPLTAMVTVDADAGVSQAVAVDAQTATVTAAAQDATAVVVSGGVVVPQTATVTAAAQDATVAVVAMAETATVAAMAVDAVAAPAPAAETATVTVAAVDATIAVAQPAGTAAVTVAAQDATASTVATTTAVAETAAVTAAAQDATAAVAPVATTATATAAAQNAVFQRFTEVIAQTALVTAAAVDPAVAIGVLAETAAVIAAAQDATTFIPPPVPPPRWVEGGPSGSGQVEGVLVGAGIVEGGSSL